MKLKFCFFLKFFVLLIKLLNLAPLPIIHPSKCRIASPFFQPCFIITNRIQLSTIGNRPNMHHYFRIIIFSLFLTEILRFCKTMIIIKNWESLYGAYALYAHALIWFWSAMKHFFVNTNVNNQYLILRETISIQY